MKRPQKIGCGALIAIAVGGYWLVNRPGRNFERLVSGDNQITLVSVTISGQNQQVELNDPESMRYLTLAFLGAQKEGYHPARVGATYLAAIRLSPGGTVKVAFYVAGDEDGLTVAYPLDSFDEPTHYWITFPKSMPDPVSTAIERMRNPQRLTGRGPSNQD